MSVILPLLHNLGRSKKIIFTLNDKNEVGGSEHPINLNQTCRIKSLEISSLINAEDEVGWGGTRDTNEVLSFARYDGINK